MSSDLPLGGDDAASQWVEVPELPLDTALSPPPERDDTPATPVPLVDTLPTVPPDLEAPFLAPADDEAAAPAAPDQVEGKPNVYQEMMRGLLERSTSATDLRAEDEDETGADDAAVAENADAYELHRIRPETAADNETATRIAVGSSSELYTTATAMQTFKANARRIVQRIGQPFPQSSPLSDWTMRLPGPQEVLYRSFFANQDVTRLRGLMVFTFVACMVIIASRLAVRALTQIQFFASAIIIATGAVAIFVIVPLFFILRTRCERAKLQKLPLKMTFLSSFGAKHVRFIAVVYCSTLAQLILAASLFYFFDQSSCVDCGGAGRVQLGVCVIVSVTFWMVPLPFYWSLVLTLFFAMEFITVTIVSMATGFQVRNATFLIGNLILFACAIMISCFAAYRREIMDRRFFLQCTLLISIARLLTHACVAKALMNNQVQLSAAQRQAEAVLYSILPARFVQDLKGKSDIKAARGIRTLLVREHTNVSI